MVIRTMCRCDVCMCFLTVKSECGASGSYGSLSSKGLHGVSQRFGKDLSERKFKGPPFSGHQIKQTSHLHTSSWKTTASLTPKSTASFSFSNWLLFKVMPLKARLSVCVPPCPGSLPDRNSPKKMQWTPGKCVTFWDLAMAENGMKVRISHSFSSQRYAFLLHLTNAYECPQRSLIQTLTKLDFI